MDLWDVAKLMGRRWYVALPVLALTVAAALLTASTVKPDYTATTHVTLLPPLVRNDMPTGPTQTINPWDTDSLTIATLTYLNSKRLHDQMKAEGFSPVWEADLDQRFRTLIIIQVTAPAPEVSQATARKLQDLIAEEVAQRQAVYKLKPGEEITTIPFDDGGNVETATSKVKRALIVVAGVGLIFTIAFTVGLDAFLRWRSGRRRGSRPGVDRQIAVDRQVSARTEEPAATGQPATGAQPATRTAQARAPATATAGRTQPTAPAGEPIVLRMMYAPSPTKVANDSSSEETRVNVTYQTADADAAGMSGKGGSQRQVAEPVDETLAADDATIVLPVSNAQWTDKIRKLGDKTAENGKR